MRGKISFLRIIEKDRLTQQCACEAIMIDQLSDFVFLKNFFFDDFLTFLQVFEPVIGSNIKMSAEEIETGLIKPDSSLARLHIDLLKVFFFFFSHFIS